MRKIIVTAIIVLPLAIVSVVGVKTYRKIQEREAIKNNIAHLPAFEYPMLSGQLLNSRSVKAEKVIINYFNPECEHCQYMAQTYHQHANELKELRILMITRADSATSKHFQQTYNLDSIPAITILLDRKGTFSTIFGTAILPSFFIYKNGELSHKYSGETKIENLLKN